MGFLKKFFRNVFRDGNPTPSTSSFDRLSEDERQRLYEEAWQRGGLPFLGAFGDLLFEKRANDTIADFARDKIRSIVKDPATAESPEIK